MQHSSPWLSILVPVFNSAPHLEACLDSVISQQTDGWELIAMDDCSTDDSLALLQRYADRHPQRIRIGTHSRNRGPGATRNTLIDQAQGDYLWFLDADDCLMPGAMTALHRIVTQQVPDLVLCDYLSWKEGPLPVPRRIGGRSQVHTFRGGPVRTLSSNRARLLQGMLQAGETHVWSKIARRSLWQTQGLQFPEGCYFEDMATSPRLALIARSFYYEPSAWIAYRQHPSSILATMSAQKVQDWSRALRTFRTELDASPWAHTPAVRLALAQAAARNVQGILSFLRQRRTDGSLPASDIRALAQRAEQDFEAISPLAPAAWLKACLCRGWWGRYRRFRRWLAFLAQG